MDTRLSEFEEGKDYGFIEEVGRRAATNAINENKALNLPVTYMEDGWVVSKLPDGTVEKVSKIESNSKRKLTKGTVLHVKRDH